MKERIRKKMGLLAVTMTFMFISAFFITGTVMSQSRDRVRVDEKYYTRLEEEYLGRVKEVLKQEGYSNCGITLTYTKDVAGERSYFLKIHNKRFDKLNNTQKKKILDQLGKVDFGVKGCYIYQEFL